MTALYSVNLRVMGKSNIPLFEEDNIFNTKYSIKMFCNLFRFIDFHIVFNAVFILLSVTIHYFIYNICTNTSRDEYSHTIL